MSLEYLKTPHYPIIHGLFNEIASKRFRKDVGVFHPAFWNDDWLGKADTLTHPLYFGETNYEEVKQGLKDILRQMDDQLEKWNTKNPPRQVIIDLRNGNPWNWDHPE